MYHPGFISHVELMTEMPTNQGRTVEHLAEIARVIVFDQRGVRMWDRVGGVPSLETRMDDVRAVMDAVGSTRAAIVSSSIGVPMSLLFAATYPSRTAALILMRGFARELVNGSVAGIAVHTGARVAAEAKPSQVLVSSTVKDLVAGSELRFEDCGAHALKGIPGEWRLFAVDPPST